MFCVPQRELVSYICVCRLQGSRWPLSIILLTQLGFFFCYIHKLQKKKKAGVGRSHILHHHLSYLNLFHLDFLWNIYAIIQLIVDSQETSIVLGKDSFLKNGAFVSRSNAFSVSFFCYHEKRLQCWGIIEAYRKSAAGFKQCFQGSKWPHSVSQCLCVPGCHLGVERSFSGAGGALHCDSRAGQHAAALGWGETEETRWICQGDWSQCSYGLSHGMCPVLVLQYQLDAGRADK